MKANSEIRIKCTSEQHEKIRSKAQKLGMSIKSYLLYLGEHSNVSISLGK